MWKKFISYCSNRIQMKKIVALLFLTFAGLVALNAQNSFRVISFFTAKEDQAHISFVHDANRWFHQIAKENKFTYDSTNNWENLNEKFLAKYDAVIFLDTRPEKPEQREAFQNFIERGGGWMGFHFAGFALTPSAFNQDWDWYHNTFIGAGSYKSNTWRPTPASLKVETKKHPATKKLPNTFKSAANEWYRWENDLTKNPDIEILVSIDSTSFPLGTGPKPDEIWHSGYYPVVWTNKKYNMIYLNMGHDDIDYENGTNKSLSSSFASKEQNQLVLDALIALAKKARARKK
jgi:uncharacterized protein